MISVSKLKKKENSFQITLGSMRLSNAEKNFSSHRKVQTLRISQADLVNDLDIFC